MPPGGISCRFIVSGFAATIASVVTLRPGNESAL
jgi:hypothetical protein